MKSVTPASNAEKRIGLLAGWGRYPMVVACSLRDQGYRVYCLGIKEHADPALREICDDYHQIGLARIGAQTRYFRRHGITEATMAGKIHKVLIFRRFYWLKHFPDWQCVKFFYPHFITRSKDRSDDSILSVFVTAYADAGVRLLPATDFAPELLVETGVLSGRRLSTSQQKDVEFGWRLAKAMGRLDVGQSVAVMGRAVLAVEAVEGTDECIHRAGQLCPAGGFAVIKVAKPQQDMRFDVPTIGLGTLQAMAKSGGGVLAVEAGRTILIDQDRVVEFAVRHNIKVVAIDPRQIESLADAA